MNACTSLRVPDEVPEGLLVPEELYVLPTSEEPHGTWIATETHLSFVFPKIVIHPWGLVEQFETPTSAVYARRNTSVTVQRWRDGSGNIWSKKFARFSIKGFYSGHAFYLTRLSSDGQTLETIFGNVGWPDPAEMVPEKNTTYVKYRRLE
ncbi:MAG: hypothetical protein JW820_16350 [Spirochaetales bacterium]|nr:hypothetical protein [Spirochaetales bacterium]